MWPIEDFPEINVCIVILCQIFQIWIELHFWHSIQVRSYIGVIIAIVGNILISVALNIQKYAHNQLQPNVVLTPTKSAKSLHIDPEEESIGTQYDARHYQQNTASTASVLNRSTRKQGYHDDGNDHGQDEEEADTFSYSSSQSSRQSSLHNFHRNGHINHGGDMGQNDTTAPALTALHTRPEGLDEFYNSDTASDTLYLRSKAWWLGMTLMILGECGNFLAYGYAQASIVAPLGTVALVSNVILAPLMLKEPFRRRDLVGIIIAVIGTIVVVINSKESEVKLTPESLVAALLQTRFIVYFVLCCILVGVLASLSDTIGSEYIVIDLGIVAIFGGYTVLATKGVSSLVSLSFYKMFTYPIAYLLVFVMVSTAVLQIKFLNKSLQRFDSTQVIPTQFVLFTTSAIIGSGILYNDFDEMDFNKAFNFLTGCCMTFLGVYFITSHRGIDDQPTAPAVVDAHEWALASQTHFAIPVNPRTSIDSYATGRATYSTEVNGRSESLMEQGLVGQGQGRGSISSATRGYAIPQPPSNRTIGYGIGGGGESSLGQTDRTPLLGPSSRQSGSGTKDQISSIASSVHNALATVGSAVGTHHTALLSLETMYPNARRNEERRDSIQSLGQVQLPSQRPPLGSRASSACSGGFPLPSITARPSSTSLAQYDMNNYGTSLQSTPTPMHFARLSNAGLANDPRYQASHLQERSVSQDPFNKNHRRKESIPLMPKEQTKNGPVSSQSKSSLDMHAVATANTNVPSSGVAVPRRSDDRPVYHPASASELGFVADVSQSLDSETSSTPKATSTAKYLVGAILSSSPSTNHAQGSEYAFQTLKSPSTDPSPASLPPLPPSQLPEESFSFLQQQQQQQQSLWKKKKHESLTNEPGPQSVQMQPTGVKNTGTGASSNTSDGVNRPRRKLNVFKKDKDSSSRS
ncbi:magnesium transporter NIPA-domain-containing protein [Lobosporangium transversale]|uniref:Magnesium transporter NIPA-domain-containing protein n=1 Tax=Lobosporangium transversale TaxID=64571 RepID=A0A1Y2GXR0_9FUNG|nr:magnesium transporter NIPA-domain-containing protein [Lobosporangium transversale]ORZ22823.1 magnesium transporter NIPA-domain-containing protein [Lobosporangium transversale]|eukprot:XP_021883377.1 magnesium transporter NIPA-domain-containing protein [Lobosporangium transversale]